MSYSLLEALKRLFYVILANRRSRYASKRLSHIKYVPRRTVGQQQAMRKPTKFVAYDLARKKMHTIPSPPSRIQQHRVSKRIWTEQLAKSAGKARSRRPSNSLERTLSTVAEVLQYTEQEWQCLQCGKRGDDPTCNAKCYRDFRKKHLDTVEAEMVDIRGPGPLGYTIFTKPGAYIKKGQWLGEYVGDLFPLDYHTKSMYCFHIADKCILDAGKLGNWTRFVNSSCKPNVQAVTQAVGKRATMFFRARKNIGPEQELFINYGKLYFKQAGIACRCASCETKGAKAKARKAKR